MGDAEHGVVGDLVQADPQPQVVGRQAPLVAERVDVGGDEHELVAGRAGDGQVVLAEAAPGEVADHRAGGHAEHHRRHGIGIVGPHGVHRVGLGSRVADRVAGAAFVGGGPGARDRRDLLEERPVGVGGALDPRPSG